MKSFIRGIAILAALLCFALVPASALASESLNVYTIWSERYATAVFDEFTRETGIKINFLRFPSGEVLARLIAEKNNPQADVFFGGIADAFVAGKGEGIFEHYVPAGAEEIPAVYRDPEGYWTGVAMDPLCFMFNRAFLEKNSLTAPTSWNDLLDPVYNNGLIMADARTAGTAVSRLFSLVLAMGEDEAYAYQRKLDKNIQQYTKSGAGGAIPIGRGQAAGGVFFIVDALEMQQTGYDVVISYPVEGVVYGVEAMGLVKGAKNPETARKFLDWAAGADMQRIYERERINLIPVHPDVKLENPALDMTDVNLLELDIEWSGRERTRLVERWVDEIVH
ncbi:MAG: ABC transporter substrate-binding protein [Synergistaceae bacterium]|nr:ABC transporter substrate-binding protein [Synergistota bacterium]NLM72334.1 ABC transporter substrate-binding protein [Synergistaceae bacterium]